MAGLGFWKENNLNEKSNQTFDVTLNTKAI